MITPMDNPKSRVVEMTPRTSETEPTIDLKSPHLCSTCQHGNFKVDRVGRTVECGVCKEKIDPMHVLVLIAESETRRRWMVESRENHERKENEKTIKAAVVCLGRRGITPDKFVELLEKYNSLISQSK